MIRSVILIPLLLLACGMQPTWSSQNLRLRTNTTLRSSRTKLNHLDEDIRSCLPVESNCFLPHDETGCEHKLCESITCDQHPECCLEKYDQTCALWAWENCHKCSKTGTMKQRVLDTSATNITDTNITVVNTTVANITVGNVTIANYTITNSTAISEMGTIINRVSLRELVSLLESFQEELDIKDYKEKFFKAETERDRISLCEAMRFLPTSHILALAAQALNSTVKFEFGVEATNVGISPEEAISFSWGESGQVACGAISAAGFNTGAFGIGTSTGLSYSPAIFGGWSTVGDETPSVPSICLEAGYSFFAGAAATIRIDPNRILQFDAVEMIKNRMTMGANGDASVNFLDQIVSMLASLMSVAGVSAVGLDLNVGVDALDFLVPLPVIPDITARACSEMLTYCRGEGCENKKVMFRLGDGTPCISGVSCGKCLAEATFWNSLATTACGSEPKWENGTVCGLGRSCSSCNFLPTLWFDDLAPMTKCGTQPKLADGTDCIIGTSCRACKNPATFWMEGGLFRCGTEPCWETGHSLRTTFAERMCCSGKAKCPWYLFGDCKCT